MTDDRDLPDPAPATLAELPLQPTGSGVADLEIAFEQMKLAEGADADPADPIPGDGGDSEAHPS